MNTAPANLNVEAIRLSVQKSYTELNQLIDGPLASLDSAKLYQPPVENEWSIMQNLAHVVEIMPYWANEIEKLVARQGKIFGALISNEVVLKVIRDHGWTALKKLKGL